MLTVYVSIGNSDDKLSQTRWAMYHLDVAKMLQDAGAEFHGEWFSHGASMWQNACWCVDIPAGVAEQLKAMLAGIARAYEQDAIAWAEVPQTQFLG